MESIEYHLSGKDYRLLLLVKNWWYFLGILISLGLAAIFIYLFCALIIDFIVFIILVVSFGLFVGVLELPRYCSSYNKIYGNVNATKLDDGTIKFESENIFERRTFILKPRKVRKFCSHILVSESWTKFVFVPKEVEQSIRYLSETN